MRLLVTNDDGIGSAFLHELVTAHRHAGHEVAVVAPKREQSWIGAAKSRHHPVTSECADCGFECPTWIVDGTPSDCVNIGLAHLLPGASFGRIDGVVSGINIGFNASLGFILASGTIAGAWEGALHGIPAIAFSQDLNLEAFLKARSKEGPDEPLRAMIQISARRAAEMTAELLAPAQRNSFIVHNINFPFPNRADATVQKTIPARVVVPGLFSPLQDDGTHRFVFQFGEDISPPDPLTDRAAIAAGHISHTILDYKKLGL